MYLRMGNLGSSMGSPTHLLGLSVSLIAQQCWLCLSWVSTFDRTGVRRLLISPFACSPSHAVISSLACEAFLASRQQQGPHLLTVCSDTSMFGSLQALPSWLNTFGTRQPDGKLALTTYQKAIANSGKPLTAPFDLLGLT